MNEKIISPDIKVRHSVNKNDIVPSVDPISELIQGSAQMNRSEFNLQVFNTLGLWFKGLDDYYDNRSESSTSLVGLFAIFSGKSGLASFVEYDGVTHIPKRIPEMEEPKKTNLKTAVFFDMFKTEDLEKPGLVFVTEGGIPEIVGRGLFIPCSSVNHVKIYPFVSSIPKEEV